MAVDAAKLGLRLTEIEAGIEEGLADLADPLDVAAFWFAVSDAVDAHARDRLRALGADPDEMREALDAVALECSSVVCGGEPSGMGDKVLGASTQGVVASDER